MGNVSRMGPVNEKRRIKLIKKQPKKPPHQEAEHQLINYINLRIKPSNPATPNASDCQ